MTAPKLTDEVKTFIVQSLACFDSPSTVAEAVKKEFGIEVSRQLVEGHDPTKKAGAKVAKKWKALFEETRKAFLEDTASIAISHRAVRLRILQRMAERAETKGNIGMTKDLLKQAAEEMGNAYTNRRELTGAGGGPIQHKVDSFTDEELEAIAAGKPVPARGGPGAAAAQGGAQKPH